MVKKTLIKSVSGRHMNWVVLDDETHKRTKNLLNAIREETGHKPAFTDMILQAIININEEQFLEWVVSAKKLKKGRNAELTSEGKTKIIRILKGGK